MAKILVVDDDREFLACTELRLRRNGHEVTGVDDGREALEKLQTSSFDIIVTDMYMPELDGIELLMVMRRWNRRVPVIAMSGGPREMIEPAKRVTRELGANAFLLKPFSYIQLECAIQAVLGTTTEREAGAEPVRSD